VQLRFVILLHMVMRREREDNLTVFRATYPMYTGGMHNNSLQVAVASQFFNRQTCIYERIISPVTAQVRYAAIRARRIQPD
jgi:hypothetical protein